MRCGLVLAIVLATAACGSDDPPPSCQQAMTHYYDSGCTLVDLSQSPPTPVPVNQVIVECNGLSSHLPSTCTDEFNAWVSCFSDVPSGSGPTSAQCDCSQEQATLSRCVNAS